jgi:hypothetical protein
MGFFIVFTIVVIAAAVVYNKELKEFAKTQLARFKKPSEATSPVVATPLPATPVAPIVEPVVESNTHFSPFPTQTPVAEPKPSPFGPFPVTPEPAVAQPAPAPVVSSDFGPRNPVLTGSGFYPVLQPHKKFFVELNKVSVFEIPKGFYGTLQFTTDGSASDSLYNATVSRMAGDSHVRAPFGQEFTGESGGFRLEKTDGPPFEPTCGIAEGTWYLTITPIRGGGTLTGFWTAWQS